MINTDKKLKQMLGIRASKIKYKNAKSLKQMYEIIDTDTHCPVCGRRNLKYEKGETDERYCGCEDY